VDFLVQKIKLEITTFNLQGFKADSLTTDSFNEIVIGSSSIGHGSNTIVLGNEESKKIRTKVKNNKF